MNAFLNSVGLETLGLRMERLCDNALQLAQYLDSVDGVEVNYPALERVPIIRWCRNSSAARAVRF